MAEFSLVLFEPSQNTKLLSAAINFSPIFGSRSISLLLSQKKEMIFAKSNVCAILAVKYTHCFIRLVTLCFSCCVL